MCFLLPLCSQNQKKNFLQLLDFEHTTLKQEKCEQSAQLLSQNESCYAISQCGVGKIIVELKLLLITTAVFKKR